MRGFVAAKAHLRIPGSVTGVQNHSGRKTQWFARPAHVDMRSKRATEHWTVRDWEEVAAAKMRRKELQGEKKGTRVRK